MKRCRGFVRRILASLASWFGSFAACLRLNRCEWACLALPAEGKAKECAKEARQPNDDGVLDGG